MPIGYTGVADLTREWLIPKQWRAQAAAGACWIPSYFTVSNRKKTVRLFLAFALLDQPMKFELAINLKTAKQIA